MEREAAMGWNKEKSGNSIRLMGLNDNLEFMGKQLHVQTENAAFPSAHIVTQVFCRGKVILSRRMDYPADVRESGDVDKMREMMHVLHFRIIKEIADKQARFLGSH
jgi:hypothetical protein